MTEHHSATVRLWLIVDDQAIKLGSIGPDHVTLHISDRTPRCQPCTVVILETIDGTPFIWLVDLPDGITGETVPIVQRGHWGPFRQP